MIFTSILLDPVVICTCFVLIHLMEADALNSKLVSYGILFPEELKLINKLYSFKNHLKSHLFNDIKY